jgi:AraC-like DNA-binding protein
MSLLDLPLKSIESFEKSTNLTLSYHVVDLNLWTYLPSARSLHFAPPCALVKDHYLAHCVQFDQNLTHEKLQTHPDGFIKVCHAGLVEWVVPVTHEGSLRIILFAGPKRATTQTLSLAQVTYQGAPTRAADLLYKVPQASPGEPDLVMELLRQLGARLEQWLRNMDLQPDALSHDTPSRRGPHNRRQILHFVHQRHAGPLTIDDLAKAMNLSPSRAAHIVKETSGISFGALLIQVRVRTAASLLAHTQLSILQVALRSGFSDLSNFHRRFRQRLHMTPLQYRKRAEARQEPLQLTPSSLQ